MKKDKQIPDNDFLDDLPENKVLSRLTSPFASKSKRTYAAKDKGWKKRKTL